MRESERFMWAVQYSYRYLCSVVDPDPAAVDTLFICLLERIRNV
jgi:hypothetical protein